MGFKSASMGATRRVAIQSQTLKSQSKIGISNFQSRCLRSFVETYRITAIKGGEASVWLSLREFQSPHSNFMTVKVSATVLYFRFGLCQFDYEAVHVQALRVNNSLTGIIVITPLNK